MILFSFQQLQTTQTMMRKGMKLKKKLFVHGDDRHEERETQTDN